MPVQTPRYRRRRPEATALYAVVQDNLETLYGAIDDGALSVRLGKHARTELSGFLDCGLLCRGFAKLSCPTCPATHLVAFSCKGRGFCPSCTGRRMWDTSAHLSEDVLPEVALRQWVLTFPHAWRSRLARDGALLTTATRAFVRTVLGHLEREAGPGAKGGALTVVQRTSSDMRLNPHLHVLVLDGAYVERDGEPEWKPARHLSTTDVAAVLDRAVKKLTRALSKAAEPEDCAVTDSAVTGHALPAGPSWKRELPPAPSRELRVEKPLCVSKDGFTLHTATRAGGADREGREKLLRYVLRPPIASERVSTLERGLVRLTRKRAYSDGTVAVEMDPLSFLCRLAAAVPPPRRHLVTYAGVLASTSRLRARIAPVRADVAAATADAASKPDDDEPPKRGIRRTWAELLARTFRIDVLVCPDCGGEDAAARGRDGGGERAAVPRAHRRGARRSAARAGARTAVLEEHRPPSEGPRRGRRLTGAHEGRGSTGRVRRCILGAKLCSSAPVKMMFGGSTRGSGGVVAGVAVTVRTPSAAADGRLNFLRSSRSRSAWPRSAR